MEEKILEILLAQWPYFPQKRAKEITTHIMEFIEWIGNKGVERFSDDENEVWTLYKYNSMGIEQEFHSIDEMYQHWLTNVYKKKT